MNKMSQKPTQFKNSIALCMIVKNESHVIKATLENLVSKIDLDYYVVSDTGSTDNTKEIIKTFFDEKNIPGEIHDDEWKDFGYNRSKALEYAFSCPSEFIFIHDADDRIEGEMNLPELKKLLHPTKPTQFSLRIGNTFTYNRPLIFHNDYKWCFKGVLHEYVSLLNPDDGPINTVVMSQPTYWIDSRREGARSKDPEKYKKDALILEKAYEEAKANKDHLEPRYAYYCAQSYKDCGELDKAIHYYMIRTKLGSYQEEVYTAYLYAGRCMISAKRPEAEIEKCFLDGWESMRDRSECLFQLANYYRDKRNFTKAYLYSSLGCKIPFPNDKFLFLEKHVYDRQIFDECAISAFYTQRYQECFKLNTKLLRMGYDPRIVSNMNFCVEPLKELATRSASYNFTKPKTRYYGITLTITTCKRYDLFEKTINSLLNNVKDLYMVERFICIDDNSSKEDRLKMLNNYPFFEYLFKRPDQKGHSKSMNAIRHKLTDEDKYILHLEDDWVFLTRRNYITKAIRALKDNEQVGQIVFNKNYAEGITKYRPEGGKPFGNNKFLIHEYEPDPAKRKYRQTVEYWPNFSLNPSIIKKEVFDKVGAFNETASHFEMEYAHRYTKAGYITVFTNRIDLLHIGKNIGEEGQNAYSLNGIKQF